jgi:hypothetical protein
LPIAKETAANMAAAAGEGIAGERKKLQADLI